MKKRTLSSLLSIAATICLLTACGNSSDTAVSAMNNMPNDTTIETETSTVTEETTTTMETVTTGEEKEESDTSVDSAGDDIPFMEGEERGEDLSTTVEETEPTETVRKAPFKVDDFDLSSGDSDFFDTEEERKNYLQKQIDKYEAGATDYESLLSALAEVGVDNTKYVDEYIEKTYGSPSPSVTQPAQNPTQGSAADFGFVPEAPAQTVGTDELHPEYKDAYVY